METTKEPLKILIVGADHDQVMRVLSRIPKSYIDNRTAQIIDVVATDRVLVDSENDRLKSIDELVGRMLHQRGSDNLTIPAYDSAVKRPRPLRVPHRQRSDKRKHPH